MQAFQLNYLPQSFCGILFTFLVVPQHFLMIFLSIEVEGDLSLWRGCYTVEFAMVLG
jgi:hypothetical protein